MFFLIYLRRELRRRMRQTVVIALGLAVGIGTVVTVTATSAGVGRAQAAVLHTLYGIGTDITVTTAPPPPKAGSGHIFSPGPAAQHEDLLGPPLGLGVLDASSVASVAHLPGVRAAAGGLILTDTKLDIPAAGDTGGGLPPPTSFTVDGVDPGHLGLGPFASTTVGSGRSLTAADASSDVAVVDSAYATSTRLALGSSVVIAGKPFTVVGIVRQPESGGSANVYIPLARAQALAAYQDTEKLTDRVDTVYVSATSAAAIGSVQKEISALLPAATVTSAASLANAVTGSLASAAGLVDDLGKWVATAAMASAFALASLLTVAAVSKRVREFGTLKALGWRSRRVVAQLMCESLAIGVLGAVPGIALGFAGAGLLRLLAPDLSATVAQDPGSTPPEVATINGGGVHTSVAADSLRTVAVHLSAPVTLSSIGLAVLLAVAGGLLAGVFGGWRAARLRPAAALSRVV